MRGRLLRADAARAFTDRTGVLAVEVDEGAEALAAALAARGLQAVADGREVLVELATTRPYDLVRDAVAELGLPLVRIEQRRHSLEDLFRDEAERRGPGASETDASAPAAARRLQRHGSIYDLGYRRYDGPRLGRRHALWALFIAVAARVRSASGAAAGRRSRRSCSSVLALLAGAPGGRLRGARGAGRSGERLIEDSPIQYATTSATV